MNSFFGGGPVGAGKQPASAARSNSSAPSSKQANSSGWGNMFKNAINQMETQLDKYLEIPASEAGQIRPVAGRGRGARGGYVGSRQTHAGRQVERKNATGASPLDSPRPQSRMSNASGGGSRSATPRPVNASEQKNSAVEPAVAAKQSKSEPQPGAEELDADLFDAFGIAADDGQQTNGKSVDRDVGGNEFERKATGTQEPQAVEESTVASPRTSSDRHEHAPATATSSQNGSQVPDASEPASTHDSDVASNADLADAPADSKVENPYIQAELKRLRTAPIPDQPAEMRVLIEERNKKVEALLLEGQSWSAKELRLSNTIKKLRADAKQHDKATGLLQKKIDAANAKSEELNGKLKKASQVDRTTVDNIKSLNTKIYELGTQRKTMERELKSVMDERKVLAGKLEKAEAEIARLRKEVDSARGSQEEDKKGREESVRRQVEQQAAKIRTDAESTQHRLQMQVEELQQRLLVVEEDARDREVSSLAQIRTLQAQLRGAESKSSDETASIQEHTLPLLQQIEDLQMRQTEQRHQWAAKEREWAAQTRAAARSADKLQAQIDAKAVEADEIRQSLDQETRLCAEVRAEADQLKIQLQTEAKIRADIRQQLDSLHETNRQLSAKLESANESYSARLAALRVHSMSPVGLSPAGGMVAADDGEPVTPVPALPREFMSAAAPTGSGYSSAANDRFSHTRNLSNSSVSSTNSRTRRGSGTEAMSPLQQPHSQHADLAAHAATKKLGAQVTSLKAQLQTALRQKHEYSQDLVTATMELEGIRKDAEQQGSLAKELAELKRRHETALEMLGEKTEEVMELQADIKEIKRAFREQIQELSGASR
ncbi:hypothetical protein DL89DRAFT_2951 [Linderina pennispora]|uniref:TATA element modulatory factor 1 TATA binding domain-containing protein n=1 Tax=Linderina pennispora TaxID=61395 RepID=A0A1Y1WK38_9FUNG|nr:uncharacterized protein DL89DRAFT_2951 [Linderina pennispora]ORX73725.1 hypothetical protein DL89DRAFT_2951 [Linderina pennispora]